MDVEMNKKMDEIMEIMHQIGSYLSDYATEEMNGKTIAKEKIENSKILETLFTRSQEAYRELYKLMNQNKMDDFGDFEEDDENFMDLLGIDGFEEMINDNINELDEYLEMAYSELRYISLNDGNGEEFVSSIYKNTKFEALRNAEYNLQCKNLDNLDNRNSIINSVDRLSFKEKRNIITYLAECKFYDEYAFKQMNKYISDFDKKYLNDERFKNIRDKLIEQKYILYFAKLNNKYNGLIQENDIGKFAVMNNYINEGLETTLLEMPEFDFEENMKAEVFEIKEEFKECIKSILAKEERLIKREKDKKRKNKENKDSNNLTREENKTGQYRE